MKTHICLVSDQAVPNLTPALDPETQPRRAVLVVSPDMKQRAAWLTQVLKERGIEVSAWPVRDAWDIQHLQQRFLELLDQERDAVRTKEIALNVTGGTKPMSIAAFDACRLYELPIFYVHPEQDRIVWLHPEGRAPHDLADRIRLEPFLRAHGARLENKPRRNVPDPRLLETGRAVVEGIGRFQRALGRLNGFASGYTKERELDLTDRNLKDLVRLFEEGGHIVRKNGRLTFPDEAARFYVNGGWLEYHVFDAVRRMRHHDPHIQDIACSVDVLREQNGARIPNELDVVFLRNNRLHLIECKTKRINVKGGGPKDASPGAEILYKLDSLRDLMGGLKARAMLVSYRQISRHDRIRADDLRIHVCAGEELLRLQDHLRRFIGLPPRSTP